MGVDFIQKYKNLVISKSGKSHIKIIKIEVENLEHLRCKVVKFEIEHFEHLCSNTKVN